jgi:HEAT repeat protein
VRTAAVSALGDIKTPKARQALLELLKGRKDAAGRATEDQDERGR